MKVLKSDVFCLTNVVRIKIPKLCIVGAKTIVSKNLCSKYNYC